ncbi:MAG TPA: cytochrome c [Bacteroidales bacterium]|nr:cytochrome c [Bacteroidales bacterium]
MKYYPGAGFLICLLFISCGGNKKSADTVNENGILVYTKYCLACHQTNGSGVPGMYPPLTKTEWVEGDKTRLINIMIKGFEGEIEVNGQVYKTAMPSHHYLSDEQIADVLTYIRSSFGNTANAVTVQEVGISRNHLQAEK